MRKSGRLDRLTPRWERPLWVCPRCGHAFANPKNAHSCVRVPLSDHFRNKPKAFALFNAFRKSIEGIGPVRIVSSRTRISFMVRVRFAACSVRKDSLRAGLWLPYPFDSPRAIKKEFIPPHYHSLSFDIRDPRDIDAELRRRLRESYHQSGCQEFLRNSTLAKMSRGHDGS